MIPGAIDCDIHPTLPGLRTLFPYLPEHWRDIFVQRGMHELVSNNYPPGAPLSCRPDWRPQSGGPASHLDQLRAQALDPWSTSLAICNCLYGVQLLFSEDMAAAIARAMNEWMARELLDREPRLRTSIVVPMQNVDLAVQEIEHWAADRRFVQVLLLVMGDMPLGRRFYWPIYAAAEKHGLPIGIHAGSNYHNPPPRPAGDPIHRGLCQPGAGFPDPVGQPDLRGVLQKVPRPARRADRIGVHLASRRSSRAWRSSGAACGTRFPGSIGGRPRSCVTTCG